jgi:translation elongation factor EF-Tu-like GTPase
MVTHAGLVIAAYNGEPGGTRNTVLFANKCGVPVYNILNKIDGN